MKKVLANDSYEYKGYSIVNDKKGTGSWWVYKGREYLGDFVSDSDAEKYIDSITSSEEIKAYDYASKDAGHVQGEGGYLEESEYYTEEAIVVLSSTCDIYSIESALDYNPMTVGEVIKLLSQYDKDSALVIKCGEYFGVVDDGSFEEYVDYDVWG